MASASTSNIIGYVASEMTSLSPEDLPLVVEFVDYLKRQRKSSSQHALSIAQIRNEARRRAELLSDVPRNEIVSRFRALSEDIRRDAIAKNTAIEGDWSGD